MSDVLEAARAKFSERINAGRRHAASQAFETACDAFTEAISIFALHPRGYLERGSVRAVMGDALGAHDDLGTALALSEPDEDTLRIHFNRGSVLLGLGHPGPAVVHFSVASAAGVEGASALLARARRDAAKHGFEPSAAARNMCAQGFECLQSSPLRALMHFVDARRLDPGSLWPVHGAGQANGAVRRPVHAANAFSEVLERGATGAMRAEALYNRGVIRMASTDQAERQRARNDLEACLRLAEDASVAFPNVGDPVQAGAIVDAIRSKLGSLQG